MSQLGAVKRAKVYEVYFKLKLSMSLANLWNLMDQLMLKFNDFYEPKLRNFKIFVGAVLIISKFAPKPEQVLQAKF